MRVNTKKNLLNLRVIRAGFALITLYLVFVICSRYDHLNFLLRHTASIRQ